MKKVKKPSKIVIGIVGVIAAGWLAMFMFSLYLLNTPSTVYPEHTEHFYVEDYSGCLNEETERYIYDEAERLENETTAQVVVVTVPNTHEDDIEDYSVNLANKWGIGQKETDNGILLLIRTGSDKESIRLEIGKGLEGVITDGKAGRILDDHAVEAKKNHEWNKLAGNTFSAIATELYEDAGIVCPETVVIKDNWMDGEAETEGTFADAEFPDEWVSDLTTFEKITSSAAFACTYFLWGVLVIIVILIFLFLGGGTGGSRSSGGGGSYSGGHSGGGGSFGGGGASR